MNVWNAPVLDLRLTAESFIGMDFIGESVELADTSAESGPVWNQIARSGAFRGHSAGAFELNAEVFADIVRNFKAQANRRIPIDFEHASEADATSGTIPFMGAPAQGWILDLEVRGGDLWGLVEWLSPAKEYVKGGKYKFFSPAIRFNSRDRVTGKPIGARMSSGALTNNPFLDGMRPMAAKHVESQPASAPLNSGASAPGTSMNLEEALKALEETSAKLKASEAEAVELKAQLAKTEDAFTLKADSAKASIELSEKKIAELESEVTALKDAEDARRVGEAFDTYKDTKKLTEDHKARMLRMLKADPEWFAEEYPVVEPSKRHLLRDLSGKDESPKPTVVEGGDQVAISLKDLTSQLMKANPKLPYEEASIQADKILNPKKAAR